MLTTVFVDDQRDAKQIGVQMVRRQTPRSDFVPMREDGRDQIDAEHVPAAITA